MNAHSGPTPALLALDWGTSSLRAYLIDADGHIFDQRRAGHGIQHLPAATTRGEGFAIAFKLICDDWLQAWPALPVLASGMIGSAQGWREAPYAKCPAGLDELARATVTISAPGGQSVRIVPGVIDDDPARAPDVMRGEETQIFGALALDASLASSACIVLPGTHSKWTTLEAARIARFSTFMTGELYGVLRHHSTLGLMCDPADPSAESNGFRLGVEAAAHSQPGDLPNQLFAVRTLGLSKRLPRSALAEYLSGLLIGHEVRAGLASHAALLDAGAPLVLLGEAALCARYCDALELLGGPTPRVIDHTAPTGLHALSRAVQTFA